MPGSSCSSSRWPRSRSQRPAAARKQHSSSSGTDPETWAADVCGALSTWTDDLKTKSQSLSSDLQSSGDLKEVKSKLVAFLDDAKASTQTMVDDVKAAGPPEGKDGTTVQEDLESGLNEARDTLDNAESKAEDLDTSNPRAFLTGSLEPRSAGPDRAAGDGRALQEHREHVRGSRQGDLQRALLQAVPLGLVGLEILDLEREAGQPPLHGGVELVLVLLGRALAHG